MEEQTLSAGHHRWNKPMTTMTKSSEPRLATSSIRSHNFCSSSARSFIRLWWSVLGSTLTVLSASKCVGSAFGTAGDLDSFWESISLVRREGTTAEWTAGRPVQTPVHIGHSWQDRIVAIITKALKCSFVDFDIFQSTNSVMYSAWTVSKHQAINQSYCICDLPTWRIQYNYVYGEIQLWYNAHGSIT